MRNREKWIYFGMIPTNEVRRVAISNFQERMKLASEGWVLTTKEAFDIHNKNIGVKIFKPTYFAGVSIYSHVYYSPYMLNQIKNGNKNS